MGMSPRFHPPPQLSTTRLKGSYFRGDISEKNLIVHRPEQSNVQSATMIPLGVPIGDFIAYIHLIITSIEAIKDSTGSASEYRRVIRTLSGVRAALENLKMLDNEDEKHKETLAVVVRRCEETVLGFMNKITRCNITVSSYSRTQEKPD